ncbi:hypothetical protein [Halalkalicoccus subterraneus]|uniref:hypothetical protein n=1 Tax=Halalkalicoccus subterraneus TaxID=2675002 RepID=UPI000EFDAA3F|nr:hypothetical protein [Halalkalicoccus subterraneus]
MRDDEDQLRTNVSSRLKKQIDSDPRTNKEIVNSLLEQEFLTEESELRNELQELDEKIEQRQKEIERKQEKQEEDRERRDDIAAQLEEMKEQKQDYNDWLDSVLNARENDETGRLIPELIENIDGFDHYDEGPREVQKDLKDRAIDQKRPLCSEDFTPGSGGTVGPYLHEKEEEAGHESSDYEIGYSSETAD